MMKSLLSAFITILVILIIIVASSALFTVKETEQAIITQFGKPVDRSIMSAGLYFKTPFIQKVHKMEKRVVEWDGYPKEFQTKDKLLVNVDTFARWRIKDPLLFYQRLKTETMALSRLDDIIDGEARNVIARYSLIELIRSVNREAAKDPTLASADTGIGTLEKISVGREKLMKEIFTRPSKALDGLGIELVDIQLKRVNYNENVQAKIYERMITERKQIADRFRSEGAGRAAEIRGQKERELRVIESEAYKKTQTIRGEADAKATEIYAAAYNKSPAAYDFYQFTKTMETYKTSLDKSTMMILTTDSDFFKYLKSIGSGRLPVPAPAAAPAPAPAEAK